MKKVLFLGGLVLSLGIQGFESAKDFREQVTKLEELLQVRELGLAKAVLLDNLCDNLAVYEQQLGIRSNTVIIWAERCSAGKINVETQVTNKYNTESLVDLVKDLFETQDLMELVEIDKETLCKLERKLDFRKSRQALKDLQEYCKN